MIETANPPQDSIQERIRKARLAAEQTKQQQVQKIEKPKNPLADFLGDTSFLKPQQAQPQQSSWKPEQSMVFAPEPMAPGQSLPKPTEPQQQLKKANPLVNFLGDDFKPQQKVTKPEGSYSYQGKSIDRNKVMDIIAQAKSMDDIEGLSINDDDEMMNALQERISGRQQSSMVAPDVAETVEQMEPVEDPPQTWDENLGRAWRNLVKNVKALPESVHLGMMAPFQAIDNKVLESDYIKGKAEGGSKIFSNMYNAALTASLTNAKVIESYQRKTEGSEETAKLFESVRQGNYGVAATSIVDGAFGFVPSMIVGALSGGTGFVPMFIGTEAASSATAKSEANNLTVEELFAQGKSEMAVPMVIGTIAGALETAGFRGITKLITTPLKAKLTQKAYQIAAPNVRQGFNNWVEIGMSNYNEAYSKTGDHVTGLSAMAGYMMSEDGADDFTKTVLGTGLVITPVGRGARMAGGKALDYAKTFSKKNQQNLKESIESGEYDRLMKEGLELQKEVNQVLQDFDTAFGPKSFGSGNQENIVRRKEASQVVLAKNTQNGENIELAGISQTKDTGEIIYNAVRENGKSIEISENDISEVKNIPLEAFQEILKNKNEQSVEEETQINQEIAQDAGAERDALVQQYQDYTYNDAFGEPQISIGTINGAEHFITGPTKDKQGIFVVDRETNKKKVVSKGEVDNVVTIPFEQFIETLSPVKENQVAPFNPSNPIQKGEEIEFEGEAYVVTGVNMEDGVVQLEHATEDGVFEQIPLDMFQQIRKPVEANVNPQVDKLEKSGAEKAREIFMPKEEVKAEAKEEVKPEEFSPAKEEVKQEVKKEEVVEPNIETKQQKDELQQKDSEGQAEAKTEATAKEEGVLVDTAKKKTKPRKKTPEQLRREDILDRVPTDALGFARRWLLTGGKLKSTQSITDRNKGVGVGKGVMDETGMAGREMRQLVGIIDNKRGVSPEVAAENIYFDLTEEQQSMVGEVQDLRNALLDVLLGENRKDWLDNQDKATQDKSIEDYEKWAYGQLSKEDQQEFDAKTNEQNYNDYIAANPQELDRLAAEYDQFVQSDNYIDYIEQILNENQRRESKTDVQDSDSRRDNEPKKDDRQPNEPISAEPGEQPSPGVGTTPIGESGQKSGRADIGPKAESKPTGTEGVGSDTFQNLNPKGNALNTLNAAIESQLPKKDIDIINSKLDFLNSKRKQYPNLTDAHENEIFEALNQPNVGRASITKKIDSEVGSFAFDPKKPLGLVVRTKPEAVTKKSEIDKKIDGITKRLREIAKLPKTNLNAQVEKTALNRELNRLNQARDKALSKTEATKQVEQVDAFEQKEESKPTQISEEQRILDFEVNRWTERIQRNKNKALTDMSAYLAGKAIGRDMNESVEAFLKRKNFTEANKWISGVINGEIVINQDPKPQEKAPDGKGEEAEQPNLTTAKALNEAVEKKEGKAVEPNLTTAQQTTAKYGWTASMNEDGNIVLTNRKGNSPAIIKVKKDTYIIEDTAGTKLMTGKGKLDQSIEKLLTNFYYATPINSEGGKEKPILSIKPTKENNKFLAVLHNIKPRGVLNALKLGGLPVPSLAITDVRNDFDSYGDITLIADKSLVDPQKKGNMVYNADVYSPRYPNVSYQTSTKSLLKTFGDISSLVPQAFRNIVSVYEVENKIQDGGVQGLKDSRTAKAMFMQEKTGKLPEAKEVFSKNVSPKMVEYVKAKKADGQYDILNAREDDKFIQLYKEQYVKALNQSGYSKDAIKDLSGKINKDNLGYNFSNVVSEVEDAVRGRKKYDEYSFRDAIDKYITENQDEFNNWADNLYDNLGVDEKIFKGYTPSGSRRYSPHNLETVVKILTTKIQNGENFNYGAGNIRAGAARKFRSLAEIADSRDKIIPRDQFESIKETTQNELFELMDKLKPNYRFDASGFGYYDNAAEALAEHAQGKRNALNETFKDLSKDQRQSINEFLLMLTALPSEYFEAKPQRAVGLGEFKAAVAPKDSDPKVIKALKDQGLTVYQYDEKVKGSRQKAVLDASTTEDLRFLLIGEKGAKNQDLAEERTWRMKVLDIARQMEAEKAIPRDIKISTGWERGADGMWRYETPDYLTAVADVFELSGKMTGQVIVPANTLVTSEINKAYPELGDVEVTIEINPKYENAGLYQKYEINGKPKGREINITANNVANAQSILLHEIQHAIQDLEGFARGGNMLSASGLDQSLVKDVTIVEGIITRAQNDQQGKKWPDNTLTLEQLINSYREADTFNTNVNNYEWALNIVEKGKKEISDFLKETPRQKYKRLAGEVEARNVQIRAEMNPDDRKWKTLQSTEDIAREDQIFLFGDQGTANSETLEKPSKPSPKASKIQKIADRITKGWKNKTPINVVKDVKEASELYPNYDWTGAEDGQVAGFYDRVNKRVVLVASHPLADNAAQVESLIFHEMISHHGVRQLIKQTLKDPKSVAEMNRKWDGLMDSVFAGNWNSPLMRSISQIYFGTTDTASLSVEQMRTLADEYIAHKAGLMDFGGTMDKIVAFLRNLMRQIGMTLSHSDAEIRNMLSNARRLVVEGNTATVREVDGESLPNTANMAPYRSMVPQSENWKFLDVIDGFYSPIEKRLLEFKQDKASATKWKEIVGKKDEAQWTGVYQYLNGLKPDQQVTKKELMDWMKENRVRIEVVRKGIKNIIPKKWNEDWEVIKFDHGTFYNNQTGAEIMDELNKGEFITYFNDRYFGSFDSLKEAKDVLKSAYNDEVKSTEIEFDNTKFSQYQLEGDKTDYKEVLVTLPSKPMTFEEYSADAKKSGLTNESVIKNRYQEYLSDKDYQNDISKTQNFKSSHFDEPNILVHLRMNTRTDSEGNKVLFLEELQSDWGQSGKKEGFKSSKKDSELKILQEESSMATFDFNQIEEELDRQYEEKKKEGESRSELRKRDSDFNKLAQQYAPAEQRMMEARKAFDLFQVENRSEVPTAPFVTDTNSWVKLGLKVALQEAITQGADKIAWTTGEQQNERYDLSKQVDKIKVRKEKNSEDRVIELDDNIVLYTTNDIINEQSGVGNDVVGKSLADVIGKEITEKILQVEDKKVFQGNDLKIGGSGMKGFYDGIVPSVAKAVTGQEVGSVDVRIISPSTEKFIAFDNYGSHPFEFETKKQATEYIEKRLKNDGFEFEKRGNQYWEIGATDEPIFTLHEGKEGKPITSSQPSITLTPAIIDEVERGLPLFKKTQDQTQSPEFKAWFGDSKVVNKRGGKPRVVYHGSNNKFTEFEAFKSSVDFPEAMYFSSNRKVAETYSYNIYEVYLKIENPYYMNANNKDFNTMYDQIERNMNYAKNNGHDGLIIENIKDDWSQKGFGPKGTTFVTFNPTQIKSATGNQGTFDISNPDIRFSLSPTQEQVTNRRKTFFERAEAMYEANVDYMYQARKMVKSKLKGRELSDAQDFVTKENLAKGKTLIMTEQFMTNIWNPFLKSSKSIKKDFGVTTQQISDYFIALHNEERHNYFKEKYKEEGREIPKDERWPTGMALKESEQIKSDFETAVPQDRRDEIINYVREMTELVNRRRLATGIISEETFQQITEQYSNYVPLRGFEDLMGIDDTVYSPLISAKGRESKSASPIPYLFTAVQEAIIRGENNLVRQGVLEFVKEYPEKEGGAYFIRNGYYVKTGEVDADGNEVWREQLEKPTNKQIKDGDAKRSFDDLTHKHVKLFGEAENTLQVYVNGKRVFIEFRDQGIVKAIKNTSQDKLSNLMMRLASFTRWLSGMRTQYSPEFGVTNLIRDVGFGSFVMMADNDFKTWTSTMAKMGTSLKTLGKYNWTGKYDENSPDSARLKEWLEAGGITGFTDLKEAKEIFDAAQKEIDGLSRGKFTDAKEFVKNSKLALALETYNKSMENAIRFSYYKTLRDQGVSIQKAAIQGKDLTVNFNRKGNSTSFIGSIYMFYNASVQGIERLLRLFADPKTRRKAASGVGTLMAAGFMQGALYGLFGEDDDDEKGFYAKIPDYVRRTNIILPWFGSNNYLKIPMPYGVNTFYVMGEAIASSIFNDQNPGKEAIGVLSAISDSFSPIGGFDFESDASIFEKAMVFATPTIAKPVAELAFNRNFAGSQIYRENFTKGQYEFPQSQMHFPGVSPVAKGITDGLSAISGGDEVKPGKIEINPEWLEHGFTTYLGGPATFSNAIISTGSSLFSGENVFEEPYYRKLPFLRRFFVRAGGQYNTQQEFYERYNDLKSINDMLREYEKSKPELLEGLYEKHQKELELFDMAGDVRKSVTDINSQIKGLKSEETQTPEINKEIEELYDAKNAIMKEFNREYNIKTKEKN